jgi:uncharacterized membrane protein
MCRTRYEVDIAVFVVSFISSSKTAMKIRKTKEEYHIIDFGDPF